MNLYKCPKCWERDCNCINGNDISDWQLRRMTDLEFNEVKLRVDAEYNRRNQKTTTSNNTVPVGPLQVLRSTVQTSTVQLAGSFIQKPS